MITFIVDEFTPCLREIETGNLYDTEVVTVKRKSFLTRFNERTGWYVNWSRFSEDTAVYALLLSGTTDVQGMIAIQYDHESKAVHVLWACTAPHNNVYQYGRQKYVGVGGHLLAIASDLSLKAGFDGFIYGEAADKELYDYYCREFNAMPLPSLVSNPYRFMLTDTATKVLRETYTYEWTDAIL